MMLLRRESPNEWTNAILAARVTSVNWTDGDCARPGEGGADHVIATAHHRTASTIASIRSGEALRARGDFIRVEDYGDLTQGTTLSHIKT